MRLGAVLALLIVALECAPILTAAGRERYFNDGSEDDLYAMDWDDADFGGDYEQFRGKSGDLAESGKDELALSGFSMESEEGTYLSIRRKGSEISDSMAEGVRTKPDFRPDDSIRDEDRNEDGSEADDLGDEKLTRSGETDSAVFDSDTKGRNRNFPEGDRSTEEGKLSRGSDVDVTGQSFVPVQDSFHSQTDDRQDDYDDVFEDVDLFGLAFLPSDESDDNEVATGRKDVDLEEDERFDVDGYDDPDADESIPIAGQAFVPQELIQDSHYEAGDFETDDKTHLFVGGDDIGNRVFDSNFKEDPTVDGFSPRTVKLVRNEVPNDKEGNVANGSTSRVQDIAEDFTDFGGDSNGPQSDATDVKGQRVLSVVDNEGNFVGGDDLSIKGSSALHLNGGGLGRRGMQEESGRVTLDDEPSEREVVSDHAERDGMDGFVGADEDQFDYASDEDLTDELSIDVEGFQVTGADLDGGPTDFDMSALDHKYAEALRQAFARDGSVNDLTAEPFELLKDENNLSFNEEERTVSEDNTGGRKFELGEDYLGEIDWTRHSTQVRDNLETVDYGADIEIRGQSVLGRKDDERSPYLMEMPDYEGTGVSSMQGSAEEFTLAGQSVNLPDEDEDEDEDDTDDDNEHMEFTGRTHEDTVRKSTTEEVFAMLQDSLEALQV